MLSGEQYTFSYDNTLSEWISDVCLTQVINFSARTWDNEGYICFVCSYNPFLDILSNIVNHTLFNTSIQNFNWTNKTYITLVRMAELFKWGKCSIDQWECSCCSIYSFLKITVRPFGHLLVCPSGYPFGIFLLEFQVSAKGICKDSNPKWVNFLSCTREPKVPWFFFLFFSGGWEGRHCHPKLNLWILGFYFGHWIKYAGRHHQQQNSLPLFRGMTNLILKPEHHLLVFLTISTGKQ